MANKKFSEFDLKTSSSDVAFVVGFNGSDNVRIAPSNLSSGGASDLNGLSDCLVDGNSVYLAEVPSGLSGNPIDNTVFGKDAGQGLTTGFGNTFIGFEAAKLITDSDNMVIIGRQAGNASSSSGDRTVAIGFDAHGSSISTDNVAIGYAASQFSGANFCVALGSTAALFNLAANSISIGYQANYNGQSGAAGIISIGYQAGRSNTSGAYNTNIGFQAGYSNTTSASRTVVGYEAGEFNTGANNTFIGYQAATGVSGSSSADRSTIIGSEAGKALTSGLINTFIGYQAGKSITSATGNVAIGSEALKTEDVRSFSTACGSNALELQNAGANAYNAAFGYQAGQTISTGVQNTILGAIAANDNTLTTGSNNIVIGYDSEPSAADVNNEITLGNSNITSLRCQVQTISSLSDSRDKTNVQPSTYGLDFINKLNPVTFDWDMRDGAKVGDKDLGFIAQELQEVDDESLQLVYANNPDRLEASYGRLIPVLVKAIQDLSAKVTALENA